MSRSVCRRQRSDLTGAGQNNGWATATFHGVTIQDLNAQLVGTVEVDPGQSKLPDGFNASRISTDGNSVYVNFEGLAPSVGNVVVLTFGPASKHGYQLVEHYQLRTFTDRDEALLLIQVKGKGQDKLLEFSTGSMPLDRAMRLLHLLTQFKHEAKYNPGLKEFKFGLLDTDGNATATPVPTTP